MLDSFDKQIVEFIAFLKKSVDDNDEGAGVALYPDLVGATLITSPHGV